MSELSAMPQFSIKTDPTLVRRIEEAARTPQTPAEAKAERISFVYGNLPQKATLQRSDVVAIVAKIEGEAA